MKTGDITKRVTVRERELTDGLLETLIDLSADWEAEESCRGYRKNGRADIEGNRIFTAEDGDRVIGYLFGHMESSENAGSVMADGTPYFELMEIYVRPEYRSMGIGSRLIACAEDAVRDEAEFVVLSTATKNWRAILHFYLEEAGMEFWNARLFKRL